MLVGCGGSGDNDNRDTKTGLLDGQIQNLSQQNKTLTVNGYQLSATQAQVLYRNQPLEFSTLTDGMRAQFSVTDNNISEMKLDPSLVGEVSAVSGHQFTVNGVELIFDALPDIRVGDWVMVTTYPTVNGEDEVVAVSRIEPVAQVEIEGQVSRLSDNEFYLGTMRVDYSAADVDDRDELVNGAWVEVYGELYDNNNFKAYDVEVEDDADFDDVEIEGLVTWVNNDVTLFELNSRLRIEVNDRTEFDDGRRSDLQSGRWVEVETVFNQGRLIAEEIDFEDGGDYERGKEFEVEGLAVYQNEQLSINGIVIVVDGNTEFDDGLTLSNLNGQWVEIEGRFYNGNFRALEIEKEDRDDDIELEGPVADNTLWGYFARDYSLQKFNGQWVDVECDFDGVDVYDCDD